MDVSRTPVIIGVGQVTNRISDVTKDARPPHELIVDGVRAAVADTGAADCLASVDSFRVVNVMGWNYPDLPGLLAEALGIQPRYQEITSVGGNTPQRLINETATAIGQGELDLALLAGGEAVASRRKAHRIGFDLGWTKYEDAPDRSREMMSGISPYEASMQLFLPAHTFGMFENAMRAAAGESIEEHQVKLGEQCAAFSRVAARHPNAWFQEARDAEDIRTITPTNRMIGFPYPKYMSANPEVDLAAATIMCSAAKAQALGVPEDRWVYYWGGATHHDGEYLSTKVNYHTSPAARATGAQALEQAGLGVDDIKYVDLYSCFPCVPRMAVQEIGLTGRPWDQCTVTGGLPYFGGPWNNYVMHAVATMVGLLREDPDAHGLVYSIAYWMTKQSIGVYGGRPRPGGFQLTDSAPYAARVAAESPPAFTETPDGPVTVESYTVAHDRAGEPERGYAYGRLQDGIRCLGIFTDASMMEWVETHEAVGASGRMSTDDNGLGVFELTEG